MTIEDNIDYAIELQPGMRLFGGKYTIEKKIGEGGFGITYRAVQSGLGRAVCIKEFFLAGRCRRSTQAMTVVMQADSKDLFDKYRKKFIGEAQTLAKLNHRGIVEVIDIFDENNTSYMVMPFVEGHSLQSIVEKKGPLSFPDAVNYLAQVASAVGYIHEQHILHRDIKPDNIMVTDDFRAILIDFGSAREFENDKTQSHTSILTQGYAPPEQYATSSRKGSYTDIYALGATLYFILTGQIPLDAAARAAEPLVEPRVFNPSIPEVANRTILKAMQIKPQDRYQTVQEFMAGLSGESEEQPDKCIADSPVKVACENAEKDSNETNNQPEKANNTRSRGIVFGLLGVAVVAILAFFFIHKSSAEKHVKEYNAHVTRCKLILSDFISDTDSLLAARTIVNDILRPLEDLYTEKKPDIYNQCATIERSLNEACETAALKWIDEAKFDESVSNWRGALKCYIRASELSDKIDVKDRIMASGEKCSYMTVNDVMFAPLGDHVEESKSFSAKNTQVLQPIVHYNTIDNAPHETALYYKIYTPEQELVQLASSERGYTSCGDFVNTKAGLNNVLKLGPWGERDGFTFKPGRYAFELWNDNTMLFSTNFEIKN